MKQLLLITFMVSAAILNAGEKGELITLIELTCFNGKIDSGSKCSTTIDLGDNIKPLKAISGLTCGYKGRVSKIIWEWKSDEESVLVLTRIFPVDSAKPTISRKEIIFKGKRIIVFEDEHQVITIGPETAETEQGSAHQSTTRPESKFE